MVTKSKTPNAKTKKAMKQAERIKKTLFHNDRELFTKEPQ